jgi:hypothetical protein
MLSLTTVSKIVEQKVVPTEDFQEFIVNIVTLEFKEQLAMPMRVMT